MAGVSWGDIAEGDWQPFKSTASASSRGDGTGAGAGTGRGAVLSFPRFSPYCPRCASLISLSPLSNATLLHQVMVCGPVCLPAADPSHSHVRTVSGEYESCSSNDPYLSPTDDAPQQRSLHQVPLSLARAVVSPIADTRACVRRHRNRNCRRPSE
jgi:hypothetical protein